MLTVVDVDPDTLAAVDTTGVIPTVDTLCLQCGASFSVVALAPVGTNADVQAMAAAITRNHRAAAHPELVP